MSYDEHDAAYDRFVDELRKEFRESALDDAELYDRVVDDFRASRLRAFYVQQPLVAEPAAGALIEAHALLPHHPRAALVLAMTAAEVCLRGAMLTPILHGTFHTEGSADLVARVVGTKDEKLVKALLRTLAGHTGIDLQVHQRRNSQKPLWEEMHDLQVKRNAVVHQAASASATDARQAIGVAETMLKEVFPAVITKLGLHLHDCVRACDSTKCGSASVVA